MSKIDVTIKWGGGLLPFPLYLFAFFQIMKECLFVLEDTAQRPWQVPAP